MPPEDFDFLRCQAALAIMLAVAATGAADYRAAQELLGQQPLPARQAGHLHRPAPRARHPGTANSHGQVRQLEAITGITLLHTGPGRTITLTADGEQFARDVAPVLKMLTADPAREK
jgi:phosphotransferase system HPr-like phosphotransfer protein